MITAVNEFLDDLRGGRMSEAPVVSVEQGQLQGRMVNTPSGKPYYSFQGIPYAKPPLGSLRFKAPQPPEPWEGVRDATSEGNVSAQINPMFSNEYEGDENCLFLNVYTPNLDGEFLPVMFWIHGGGFRWGSGNTNSYGPDYLVEKDVVVVTINYRCGPLGFLCLNTPEVPGNAGLKDQIQALRWVKENIHNFGGNSGNITIFGESAGGVSTSILTASPLSKNLISKAIMESGFGLCSWAFQDDPIGNAKDLARHLGCEAEDVDEILEFLTSTPAKDLVEAYDKIDPLLRITDRPNHFMCVIEKEFPGVEAVISEAFIDILTSGRVADVPIMIGCNTLEVALDINADDLQAYIPSDLKIERNSPESLAIAEKLKQLYLNGQPKSMENILEQCQLLSDKMFNIYAHRYVKYLIQATNKPVYYYRFDYVGELNLPSSINNVFGFKYAMHADELGYLFKNDFQKDKEPTPQDIKTRERMVRLWTNFAKCGNPTPDENHYITTTWLPVNKDTIYYLNIGSELTLDMNPDKEKRDFWDDVYNKHFKIWDHPKTNTIEAPRKTEPEIVSVIETVVVTTEVEVPKTPEPSPEIVDSPPKMPEVPAPEPVEPVVEEPVVQEPVVQEPVVQEPVVKEPVVEPVPPPAELVDTPKPLDAHVNGVDKKPRTSNEIKMVQHTNGVPKDVIRANDPPEDDLPKNIGVNKFVNFFESLGGKK